MRTDVHIALAPQARAIASEFSGVADAKLGALVMMSGSSS